VSAKVKRRKSAGAQLLELVVIVAIALGLALLIQAFLIKPYRIPSESMEQTLAINQRVLVNRLGIDLGGDPEIGEILVFHPPAGADSNTCGAPDQGSGSDQACSRPTSGKSDQNFIKRVVAGPGDTLAIRNGRAVLNGKLQKESFIEPCQPGGECNFPDPIRIPKDHWFMMGDNRGRSDDSRFWGPVPRDWIIGDAFFTYWPPDRIGFL
jgi:signal peptidase I